MDAEQTQLVISDVVVGHKSVTLAKVHSIVFRPLNGTVLVDVYDTFQDIGSQFALCFAPMRFGFTHII